MRSLRCSNLSPFRRALQLLVLAHPPILERIPLVDAGRRLSVSAAGHVSKAPTGLEHEYTPAHDGGEYTPQHHVGVHPNPTHGTVHAWCR